MTSFILRKIKEKPLTSTTNLRKLLHTDVVKFVSVEMFGQEWI